MVEAFSLPTHHPIWSQDRHDHVAAMDLRLGERLKNVSGYTVWVQQKLPRPGPTPVYNLEVQDKHVYYVGASGVLAHNVGDECKSNVGVLVDGGNVVRKVRFGKGLRHLMKKHISGNGPLSLKTLDPDGNIDKWVAHIAQTASSGIGTIRPIPNGATLEIIAPMLRESDGTLNVGVRLFRQTGDDFWRLSTLLTEQ